MAEAATTIFTNADSEDLNGCIQQSDVTCLNEDSSHNHANLFMGDARLTLKSDADGTFLLCIVPTHTSRWYLRCAVLCMLPVGGLEQLLISIPFGQTVKLKQISINAPDDGTRMIPCPQLTMVNYANR